MKVKSKNPNLLGRLVAIPNYGIGRKRHLSNEGGNQMSPLQEVEKLLADMTRAEKAQLLQWVVRDYCS